MEHEHALEPGHRLQEYEIVRLLGHGGFGITYLAYDTHLDQHVALKEYLPNDFAVRRQDTSVVAKSSTDQEDFDWGLRTFLNEAKTLARFKHPNLIQVYRYLEAHNTAYIVMEYAEGQTLSEILKAQKTLSEPDLKGLLYPLLDGLEQVHRVGILHRDIKPGNIIIRDKDQSPVLIDFGAARHALGAKSKSLTSIITAGYSPIEQYTSKGKQGPWTDIYSLGAVCYRAITGEAAEEAADRILNDELIPAVEAGKGKASDVFLRAIDASLRNRHEERPQSIEEWRAMLGGTNTEQSSETQQEPSLLELSGETGGEEKEELSPEALYFLGMQYETGQSGITPDLEQAAQCFKKAADQGHAAAQNHLGVMYKTGQGVRKNKRSAIKWFRLSANQGNEEALYNLRKIEEPATQPGEKSNTTVSNDEDDTSSGGVGSKSRKKDIIVLVVVCLMFAGLFFWAQNAEHSKEITEHFQNLREKAEQGDVDAQYELGSLYFYGTDTPEDEKEGVVWIKKAAEQGDSLSQHTLGVAYEYGLGVAENHKDAAKWYRKAADQGEDGAEEDLATLCQTNNYSYCRNSEEKSETTITISASTGKEVYDGVCFACHADGIAGAPKYGNVDDWTSRLEQGKDVLYDHAINGSIGSTGAMMPAKGGRADISDDDVKAAVDYMLEAIVGVAAVSDGIDGKAVYDKECVACHGGKIPGIPKLGDKKDWEVRIAQGKNVLYEHAINGFMGSAMPMPPKGGAELSDDEVRAAVDYMIGSGS